MLADHLKGGQPLNGHEDVSETFRRLVLDDKRDREAREKNERCERRRRNIEGAAAPLTGVSEGRISPPKLVFPTKRLMGYGKSSKYHVQAYGVWQRSLRSEEQKGWFDLMVHLTLERGYDLDIMASNPGWMYYSYTEENDIPESYARSYVCDVPAYHKLQKER